MDATPLIDWDISDDNRMIGTLDRYYAIIRKTNYNKPFELRFFHNGDIRVLSSFDDRKQAMAYAQAIVTSDYNIKPIEIKKNNKKNIVNMSEWRERHESKK